MVSKYIGTAEYESNPLQYGRFIQDWITFSSTSLFTIMLYTMDHVKTLVQIFGGGTGEIIDSHLTKGCKYIISSSKLVDKCGQHTDHGIEVDIPMLINPEDSTAMH